VIAANGGSKAALAAKAATATIPIVFTFGDGDPVKHGLVESLSRPGGNVTGITMIAGLLESKRLQLIREVVPQAKTIHMLVNPGNAGIDQDIPEIEVLTRRLGVRFEIVTAVTESEIDAAFATLAQQKAQALMVANDGFFTLRAAQIAALAIREALPTVFPWREQAMAGGLMSYGTSIREAYRQSGIYVGQILKGAKPAELPVQQPTKFELVINRTTAKVLGVDFPISNTLSRKLAATGRWRHRDAQRLHNRKSKTHHRAGRAMGRPHGLLFHCGRQRRRTAVLRGRSRRLVYASRVVC
jgi:putative ABC transport system substrate-binding protein